MSLDGGRKPEPTTFLWDHNASHCKSMSPQVNLQLKFLADNNILDESQSGFRNDIINASDRKQHCAPAFDSVNHELLSSRLSDVGWAGYKSSFMEILRRALEGSVLGPVIFSIFKNNTCKDIQQKCIFMQMTP